MNTPKNAEEAIEQLSKQGKLDAIKQRDYDYNIIRFAIVQFRLSHAIANKAYNDGWMAGEKELEESKE